MSPEEIQTYIKARPHWRIRIKPFDDQTKVELPELEEIVRTNRVLLRGWDYPHCSNRSNEWERTAEYVACKANFQGEVEYWRMYLSHQFIHLLAVREAMEISWRDQLFEHLRFNHRDEDLSEVQGCISVLNWLYCVTEIFEFAAKLATASFYIGEFEIEAKITGVKNFALTTDPGRSLLELYMSRGNDVGFAVTVNSTQLITESRELAIQAAARLFYQFNWVRPALEQFRKDQAELFAKANTFIR